MDYAPLIDPFYLDTIYDNRRRNRFPQSSCQPQYNIPSEAFARLKPSYLAQPFLSVANDGSLHLKDEQQKQARNVGPYTAVTDALNQKLGRQTQQRESVEPKRNCLNDAARALDNGELPGKATATAIKQLYQGEACRSEPCNLVVRLGDCFACKGGLRKSISKYGVQGQNGPPALQLPGMDNGDRQSAFAGGFDDVGAGNNYDYDSMRQFEARSLASNNWYLNKYHQFVMQWEKERLRTQYGFAPPFPEPCPPTKFGSVPRYDPPPLDAQKASPVIIERQALVARDDCGCNKSECATGPRGSTCAPCFDKPQSVAGIYARQSK